MRLYNPATEGHKVLSGTSAPNDSFWTTGQHEWLMEAHRCGLIEFTVCAVLPSPPALDHTYYRVDSGLAADMPARGDAWIGFKSSRTGEWVEMTGNPAAWADRLSSTSRYVIDGGIDGAVPGGGVAPIIPTHYPQELPPADPQVGWTWGPPSEGGRIYAWSGVVWVETISS